MTPVVCQTKHDPEAGTYGDCMRACVASIMDMTPDQVPHFIHDGRADLANDRIRDFLAEHGFAPFVINCGDEDTYADILEYMGNQNPNAHYMLFGRTAHEDHVVVCRGGALAHDPAWYWSPLIGPGSSGVWAIMVIARS
jgi:hypothetical protein